MSEALKGPLEMMLLAALRRRPAHGNGIVEELRSRSEATFDLPEGAIYPALHCLERHGRVTSEWADACGKRRRVYRLTRRGRRALGEEAGARRRAAWGVAGGLEVAT